MLADGIVQSGQQTITRSQLKFTDACIGVRFQTDIVGKRPRLFCQAVGLPGARRGSGRGGIMYEAAVG